ncbi:MAG: hypothetical protein ACXVB9_05040 [Bdellovibrionota bacterium]
MKNLFLIALLAFLAVGCSPKSIDDYHTAENDEQIVRLLNSRDYGKVIFLIESKSGKMPEDKNTAFLLGQAYLGKAGVEPLQVAGKVSAAQDFSSADAKDLLPSCSSAALDTLSNADPLCLLKRVYFHMPDPDLEEMTRARDLFRHAYPDPATSPEWVNILVGMIETAAVVKRAGEIYLLAKHVINGQENPSDAQLRWFTRQLKLILDEADQALSRADHSGNKITQLLTGNGGSVWFERVADGVHWAKNLGLANLLDLIRNDFLSPADNASYGPFLDKIRGYLDEQDKRIAQIGG